MLTDKESIREARQAMGWSQAKLAEEAGTTQQTIDKIERGIVSRTTYLPEINKALQREAVAPDALVVLRTILCANPTAEQIVAALHANGLKIVKDTVSPDDHSILRNLVNDKTVTARRIAATRKSKHLSQEQLAEKLGCHVVTISKLETGVMDLTMEWILRIADALQVTPNRFTEDRDVIHDPLGYVQDVMQRHGLNPASLAKAVGMAGSTFTRAFNDPGHKFMFSTRTLLKIKEWDQSQ